MDKDLESNSLINKENDAQKTSCKWEWQIAIGCFVLVAFMVFLCWMYLHYVLKE